MSHFAKLDKNNIVIFVTVGRDEDNEIEISNRTGDVYKQTSYNTRGGVHYNHETKEPSPDQSKAFRKNYAGIGFSYDPIKDAFIPPRPFPSWVLDENTCLWEPPVSVPENGIKYVWNEEILNWEKM